MKVVATLLVVAAVTVLLVAARAGAATSAVTLEAGPTRPDGTWEAIYTITPDRPEAHPTADVGVVGSSYQWTGPWPYRHAVTVAYTEDHYSLAVRIAWPDGATYDSGLLTVRRDGTPTQPPPTAAPPPLTPTPVSPLTATRPAARVQAYSDARADV